MSDAVALLDGANRMLAEAETVLDFKDVRDQARVAENLAQVLGLGKSAQNRARAVVFKAERGMSAAVKAGQDAGLIAKPEDTLKQSVIPDGITEDAGPRPASFADLGITAKDVYRGRQLAEVTDDEIDAAAQEATDQGKTLTRPHVLANSGNNEWYTPPEYIEAARATLGHIALDPASSPIAQRTVGAAVFFTADDDGLTKDWFGPVWLNPPYAQPLIGQFVAKLVESEVEAVCLVNNGTETAWGQELLAAAGAVCFPKGRIRFIDQEGKPSGAPLQGQMVAYLGDNGAAFGEHFARFGVVLRG